MVLIVQVGPAKHEQSGMAYSVRPWNGGVRVRRGCLEDPDGAPCDLRQGPCDMPPVWSLLHEEAGQAEHDSLCAYGGWSQRAPADLRWIAANYGPAMAARWGYGGRAGLAGLYPTRVAVGGSVVLVFVSGVFVPNTVD